jgi:hypothetical protein
VREDPPPPLKAEDLLECIEERVMADANIEEQQKRKLKL